MSVVVGMKEVSLELPQIGQARERRNDLIPEAESRSSSFSTRCRSSTLNSLLAMDRVYTQSQQRNIFLDVFLIIAMPLLFLLALLSPPTCDLHSLDCFEKPEKKVFYWISVSVYAIAVIAICFIWINHMIAMKFFEYPITLQIVLTTTAASVFGTIAFAELLGVFFQSPVVPFLPCFLGMFVWVVVMISIHLNWVCFKPNIPFNEIQELKNSIAFFTTSTGIIAVMIIGYVAYSAFHRYLHSFSSMKVIFYMYSIFGLYVLKLAFEYILVTLFHMWDFSAVPLVLTTIEFLHKTMQTVLVGGYAAEESTLDVILLMSVHILVALYEIYSIINGKQNMEDIKACERLSRNKSFQRASARRTPSDRARSSFLWSHGEFDVRPSLASKSMVAFRMVMSLTKHEDVLILNSYSFIIGVLADICVPCIYVASIALISLLPNYEHVCGIGSSQFGYSVMENPASAAATILGLMLFDVLLFLCVALILYHGGVNLLNGAIEYFNTFKFVAAVNACFAFTTFYCFAFTRFGTDLTLQLSWM